MKFEIGIVGSGSVEPKMRTSIGQDIIYRLCQNPLLLEEIPSDVLKSFQKVGAIRVENDICYLNFTCFFKKRH